MPKPKKRIKVKPLEYVAYVMDQMGFKQADLVRAGCGAPSHVSEMLHGKRKLTLNFIRVFLDISHREEMAYMLIQKY
jgi:antitoxin component HigA of HigAB toxin-antitoxin module